MAENIVRLLRENDLSYIEIKRLLRLSDEELTKVLDRLINEYRKGSLRFSDSDLIENVLSHSYVLGNFEYAGLVCVEGSKYSLKITLNKEEEKIIDEILG